MEFGVVFPQTEIEFDPEKIQAFATTVESLGFAHIFAYEHVLGEDPEHITVERGPYTLEHGFLSPFVLFPYMAAVTRKIGFVTGILILPQRQTALVAKQAATLDILSGGRLRLGIGIGWNEVEYIALGEDFHDRGRRSEEQIELLRALWTRPSVFFQSEWHTLPNVGLNPKPVQQPIPIWIGGGADAVLRRAARLADGWMPNHRGADDARPSMVRLASYLEQAGRSPEEFGVEPRILYADGDMAELERSVDAWRSLGATKISLNTMGSGFQTLSEHAGALHRFAEVFLA